MTIYEQFKDALLDEQRHGRTQVQIASAHNVSQQYVSKLLCKNNTCEGITLGVVSKMFPHATLNLTGTSNITQVASNVRVQNGSVNSIQNGKTAEQFRQEAIMKMLELDLDGDTLKSVLTALKGIEV